MKHKKKFHEDGILTIFGILILVLIILGFLSL